MNVDFLIVGTQKGGTTALAQFLSEHPHICMPDRKEVHYFDTDKYFELRDVDCNDYHASFQNFDVCKIYGEATPIYMYWKESPVRIKAYNPDMKLIFLLRNPIERAYSHYVMEHKRKVETWSFSSAIRFENIRCLRSFPKQDREYSYVDRGFYTKQILRMIKNFPRQQMLFIKTEELKNNHTLTINKICDYLGVYRLEHHNPTTIFSNSYPSMRSKDRKYLLSTYISEINKLEELLDWDCSSWKEF